MNFRQANQCDINAIHEIMERAKNHMHEKGIEQWNEYYPCREDYQKDIENQSLFVGELNCKIVCIFTLDANYEPEYEECEWSKDDYLVLHRLCVDPNYQHQGLAKECMLHIFETFQKSSIRLDVFVKNPYALRLYQNLGFKKCGQANWFGKDFYIMEKCL